MEFTFYNVQHVFYPVKVLKLDHDHVDHDNHDDHDDHDDHHDDDWLLVETTNRKRSLIYCKLSSAYYDRHQNLQWL